MADVKKVSVSYLIDLSHEEFALIFRAVGVAVGAKVRIKPEEVIALRTLNAKLARIRLDTLAQMFEAAQGAAEHALALAKLELDAEKALMEGESPLEIPH